MYPEYIYEGVRHYLGYGETNTEYDKDIDNLSKRKVLDLYLKSVGGIRDSETFELVLYDIFGLSIS